MTLVNSTAASFVVARAPPEAQIKVTTLTATPSQKATGDVVTDAFMRGRLITISSPMAAPP
jgi:hypothetical protein